MYLSSIDGECARDASGSQNKVGCPVRIAEDRSVAVAAPLAKLISGALYGATSAREWLRRTEPPREYAGRLEQPAVERAAASRLSKNRVSGGYLLF